MTDQVRDGWGCGGSGYTGNCASGLTWIIELADFTYSQGSIVRHEIGHLVQGGLHSKNIRFTCDSYDFNGTTGYAAESCEWGFTSMKEGLASFIAVRSVTTADTFAWDCRCTGGTPQSACTSVALGGVVLADSDRVTACGGVSLGFAGVGDTYASAASHCSRVRPSLGCNCTDANGNNICDDYQSFGHRNDMQIMRFFFDMIDTSTDGGSDDTDLSMNGAGGLASIFESMSCSSGTFGVDGTCNEPHRSNPATCSPSNPSGTGVTPMMTTRDSYNPYDFGSLIPGDQTAERQVNCVQVAGD